jgi:hypothetical protein
MRDMRGTGVRGVLIYCQDFIAATRSRSARTNGLITSGYLIWRRGSPAEPAAREAPTCGRIFLSRRQRAVGTIPVAWRLVSVLQLQAEAKESPVASAIGRSSGHDEPSGPSPPRSWGLFSPPRRNYLGCMRSTFEFCIPTRGTKVPDGPDWLHEIKYDGYRLRVERDGARVRLISRNGYDWTKRYPWIVESALKNKQKQFVIDGEAVVLGVDGIADFSALHSRKHDDEVQLYVAAGADPGIELSHLAQLKSASATTA